MQSVDLRSVHALACVNALRRASVSGHLQPVRALRRATTGRGRHRARRDNRDGHRARYARRAGRIMWRMCGKACRVEQTIKDVARVVQMPLPGFNSITVTQATYREVTRLAKELRVSRAEILRRASADKACAERLQYLRSALR